MKRWYFDHGLFLPITFCVLPQLAISEHFTVNVHKSLIVALSFNFARPPPFCQTAAGCWRSVCRCTIAHCLRVSLCVGLVALLHFFVRLCVSTKNVNVLPKVSLCKYFLRVKLNIYCFISVIKNTKVNFI